MRTCVVVAVFVVILLVVVAGGYYILRDDGGDGSNVGSIKDKKSVEEFLEENGYYGDIVIIR